MQIPSAASLSANSGSKSNITSQQQQTTLSLKNQVNSQAKTGEKAQKLTHQQMSSA